jgi:prepilin-type N-terminal cleavage/methylation domain-containing protein
MSRDCAFRKPRGFSLVELMIVLALIAMMALLAAPWFVKMHQRSQIRSAAFELETTLLAARMKAVKRNQQVSVALVSTPTAQPIVFRTNEPPPGAGPTPVPRLLEIPANAAQLVATPTGGVVTFGGDGRLVAPPPAPTPNVIILKGPVGAINQNTLTIETSSGGRVKVITPAVWQ